MSSNDKQLLLDLEAKLEANPSVKSYLSKIMGLLPACIRPPDASNVRTWPLMVRSYTTAVFASGHHTAAKAVSPTRSLTTSW